MVILTINGRRFSAIIDTGSVKSICRRDIVVNYKLPDIKENLRTAGGHMVPILGYADVEITEKGFNAHYKMAVIEKCPFDLILGADFLQTYGAKIDFKEKMVTLIAAGTHYRLPLTWRGSSCLAGVIGTSNESRNQVRNPYRDHHGCCRYKALYYDECLKKIKEARTSINTRNGGTVSENNLAFPAEERPRKIVHKEAEKIDYNKYTAFWEMIKNEGTIAFKGSWTEKEMDLFTVPAEYALGHCISADFNMSRGIASRFKQRFNGVQELISQNKGTGELAVLKREEILIYYLITKERCYDKPRYEDLFRALTKMRDHIVKHNIRKLALPKIGCGLDKLQWKTVAAMLKYIFADLEVEILICVWNPEKIVKKEIRKRSSVKEEDFSNLPHDREENKVETVNSASKVAMLSQQEDANVSTALNAPENTESWNSLPSYCEGEKQIVLKAVITRKNVLDPFQEKEIEITLKPTMLGEDRLSNVSFIIKEQFFKYRRLVPLTGLYYRDGKVFMRVFLKSTVPQALFAQSTVGFLSENSEISDSMGMFNARVEEDEEMVTPKDHDLDHIEDYTIKQQLADLLEEYNDVFAKNTKYMGRTDLVKHRIELEPGTVPIKCNPYRVSHKEREIIQEQIEEMLEHKIITPCHSPWAFPVVLVKKKDGTTRFCVDYRKLNEKTRKVNYPLPNIDDIMTYMGGSSIYSSLDLYSGYWQIDLENESKDMTAFMAQGQGAYRFEVLPFGLCGGPATFQLLADRVFEGMKWKDILIYLDDIIVFSKDPEEHLEKLRKVFQRLREAGLTLKPSKCEYMKEEIKVLGFKVNKTGILPDDDNIRGIREFPTPKKLKDVQSFLGTCGFYRKFIRHFSNIASPLHILTRKDVKFHWGTPQENAFQILKRKLISPPVLHHFNPEKGTILHVDASKNGIGGVLLQEDDQGVPHPIAYVSRSLNKNEVNYTISEIEGLAVVWILGYLRHLIYGRPIKIVSDHSALCWLKSIKNSGRLCRWSIALSDYDYTITYKKGCLNKDADCLSRYPVSSKDSQRKRDLILEDYPLLLLDMADLANKTDDEELVCLTLSPEVIKSHQDADGKIQAIVNTINDPDNASLTLRKRSKQFRLRDGILYKLNNQREGLEELLVIPQHLVGEIMWQHHSCPLSAHLGLTKSLHRIKTRYYWDSLQKDVTKFVLGCKDCQARKGLKKRPAGLLQPVEVGLPFQKLGLDLLGPFRKSKDGKTMVVVGICYATRYVEAKALPDGKAPGVAKFVFENIIARHGAPQIIVSDQGKVFQSELFKELLKIMGVNNRFVTAYRHAGNGLCERQMATIEQGLALFTNTSQTDWSSYLPHIVFGYNTSIQETTKHSPFELVYGRYPVLPCEATLVNNTCKSTAEEIRERALAVRSEAVSNIMKKQEVDKLIYDSKHRPEEFNIGDKVKLFVPFRQKGKSEKLLLRYFGPYYVEEKIGEVNYRIRKGAASTAKREVVHVSRILPYHDQWSPEPEGGIEREIELTAGQENQKSKENQPETQDEEPVVDSFLHTVQVQRQENVRKVREPNKLVAAHAEERTDSSTRESQSRLLFGNIFNYLSILKYLLQLGQVRKQIGLYM